MIFDRLFINCWYPWSCKKIILSIYSLQNLLSEEVQKIIKSSSILASFLDHLCINFRYFFGIDFCIDFWMHFWWKIVQKWTLQIWMRPPLEAPFGYLFRTSIFGCILVAFWSLLAPFGCLFGSIWFTFGSFWLLLAPFWLILAPFGTFWLHFGCLGAILVHFGPFWCKLCSEIGFWGTRIHKSPADSCLRPQREQLSACTPTFLGPERVYCRRQLRSAPGRTAPGVLAFVTGVRSLCTALFLHCTSSCTLSCTALDLHCTFSALHLICTAPHFVLLSFWRFFCRRSSEGSLLRAHLVGRGGWTFLHQIFIIFRTSFFIDFLDFGSIGLIFSDFSWFSFMTFSSIIFAWLLIDFLSIWFWFLEPSILKNLGFSLVRMRFTQNLLSEEVQKIIKSSSILASFLDHLCINFRYFFGIDFCIDFWMHFWWKIVQKWTLQIWMRPPLEAPFGYLFRTSIFGCILVAFWSLLAPFGCLFGSIWFTFGSFWLLLAPFWLILAPFGTFWLHFGCLGAILVHFGPFWCKLCSEIGFSSTRARKSPAECHLHPQFRMHTDFPRPGSGYIAAGNWDPLRAVGSQSVFAFVTALLLTLHCTLPSKAPAHSFVFL